jgi:hypothetical protein
MVISDLPSREPPPPATGRALAAGKVLPPAKSLEDMQSVVTNSTVDGILAAFFAILV